MAVKEPLYDRERMLGTVKDKNSTRRTGNIGKDKDLDCDFLIVPVPALGLIGAHWSELASIGLTTTGKAPSAIYLGRLYDPDAVIRLLLTLPS